MLGRHTLAAVCLSCALGWSMAEADGPDSQRHLMLSELMDRGELTVAVITDRAELVATGRVTRLDSRRGPSANSIVTDVSIGDLSVLKGTAASTITFTTLGGSLGGTTVRVSHTPSFGIGDEVMVFLRTYSGGSLYPDGSLVLVGDELGTYSLGHGSQADSTLSGRIVDHVRRLVSGEPVEVIRIGAPATPGNPSAANATAGKVLAVPSISSAGPVNVDWDPTHPYHPLADTLVINGTDFGTQTSSHRVRYTRWKTSPGALDTSSIDATNSAVKSWTSTRIKMVFSMDNYATTGSVWVYTPVGGWSSAVAYDVRFHTDIHHKYWSDARAAAGISFYMNYSTYAVTSPTGSVTDLMWTGEDWHMADTLGVDKGFRVWQDVANSNLVFVDAGYTAQIERNPSDKYNVVVWEKGDVDWAAYTFATSTGDTLCDCDIAVNWLYHPSGGTADTLFWSTKPGAVGSQGGPPTDSAHPWRADPKDVWEVLSHEVGHCLGLGHAWGTADASKTMYYSSGRRDTQRRDLTADDAAGVQWLYYSAGKGLAQSAVEPPSPLRPASYGLSLHPNYPNPFNPQTSIHFSLRESGQVTIRLFDSLGQEVRTLVPGALLAGGDHHIVWDGRDDHGEPAASGLYIARVTAAGTSLSARMVLTR